MRLFNRLPIITLIYGLLLIAGCSSGGGDGGTTTSFTVSASAGANGSISPASVSVIQNNTTSFTVTPDAGYMVDTVSGCGGLLTGNTYTTGAVTADCSVSASFIAASFTVSTSAGANGSISPDSVSVNQNGTANFTVTPDAGFLIDAISGCGGSLAGNIYTTGAVTADCTVTVSFIARVIQTLNPVTELFSNAAKWNDYAPGSQWSTATNTACTAASDSDCIHGGEHRMVLVTGKTECTGLSATDALGAFNWVCDNSLGTAQMISTGLADGKYLSDLIDFTTPGFKANAVTVSDSIGVWGVTPSTAWWSNPVVVNNAGGNLSATDSTIYLVTSDPGITWGLNADKLSLVAQPGVTLTAVGGISEAVRLFNADYLWFEGNINATGNYYGVFLGDVRFSVLNNVVANNTDQATLDTGIFLRGSPKNRLIDVTASNNGISGIGLDNASMMNNLSNVTTNDNGSNGISLDNTSNNRLSAVTASNNGSNGIRLNSASFNTLQDLTVNNNGSSGVEIATSNNNILSGVMASNNDDGIFLNSSSNNILTDVTTSNNNFYGIALTSSSNNRFLVVTSSSNDRGVNLSSALDNTFAGVTVNSNNTGINLINAANSNAFMGVTASNNGSNGVSIASSNNTLLGVTASNNATGIKLDSSNNTLSDLAAGNNNNGVELNSSNTFTGWLEVGNNSNNDCVGGLPDCAINGASNHTLVTGIDLTNAFVGKVLIDDTMNDDDTDGAAASFPAAPAAFDWTNFDNNFRGWGVDGSAFPSANHRGRWNIVGVGGRIWDWSVSIGDNGNAGNPALLNVLTLPAGSETLTHVWGGTPASNDTTGCNAMVTGSVWNGTDSVCETRFLRKTVELPADGVGNDNTLCESSETCIYLPNIGSYQGHGDFVSAGAFTDGILTGITLIEYETNGR